jgi:hypothetical protein
MFRIFKIYIIIVSFGMSVKAQTKTEAPLSDLFSNQSISKSKFFFKNEIAIEEALNTEPRKLIVPIHFRGRKINVLFKKQNLLSEEYSLISESKKGVRKSQRPLFYTGIVEGQNNSNAYLAISKDELSLNITENGKYWSLTDTQSKAKSPQYVLSENHPALTSKNFDCHSTSGTGLSIEKSLSKSSSQSSNGKVSIYFEADHELFLQKGSVESVESYVQLVFAQVAVIFANENIDLEILQIKVWDIPDPYDKSTSQSALTTFRSTLSGNFVGDLAHLVSGNSSNHGGKAYIDVLCDESKSYAYSNVSGGYNGLSDYSWDAFIIAHELGHNFGSRHTHECVWGPNGDQAIDECGRTNETCDLIQPNPEVGTIMSYCHLDPIGISFAQGFGIEPGDLIRSRYNACHTNTGINCESAIEIVANGKYTALGPVKGYGASQSNADHSNWYSFIAPGDGKVKIFNCSSGVDSRLWIHSGDCSDMIVIASSDDTCGPSGQYAYSSSIPQLTVTAGEKILIEWDDRWDDDGFDFYFKFGESNL